MLAEERGAPQGEGEGCRAATTILPVLAQKRPPGGIGGKKSALGMRGELKGEEGGRDERSMKEEPLHHLSGDLIYSVLRKIGSFIGEGDSLPEEKKMGAHDYRGMNGSARTRGREKGRALGTFEEWEKKRKFPSCR